MSNTTKKFAGLDALQVFLDGCKTLFASITHKHTMSDIEDYVVDTELSPTSTNPIANSTVNEELEAVSTAMGVLGSAIDGKLDTATASSTYETKEDAQTKYDTITNAKTDWNQNDETAIDYIKNRTHWIEQGTGICLIPAQSFSYPSGESSSTRYRYLTVESTVELSLDKTYKVVYNGVTYERCKCLVDFSPSGNIAIVVPVGGGDIPSRSVCIAQYSDTEYRIDVGYGVISQTDANGNRTIAVYEVSETVHKLNEVFIPDTIARTEDIASTYALKTDLENIDLSAYETTENAQSKLDEAKEYTDNKTADMVTSTIVDNKISTHNTATDAHNDIRDLIDGLSTRLNALADSDDETLDQMSEIVEYIKANKALIDSVTTSKVNVSDIIDNLTTNVGNKPLSAAQGVAIKTLIDTITDAKADWNQNDVNAIDYIKNRTHWAEQGLEIVLSSRILDNDDNVDVSELPFVASDELIVAVDGVSYKSSLWHSEYDEICWGDSRLYDEENYDIHPEDVPYCIIYYVDDSFPMHVMEFVCFKFADQSSHTVEVKRVTGETTYHPLDENFIPDSIARTEDIAEIYATKSEVNRFYDSETPRVANTVLAAPDGGDGTATFRRLVGADLPRYHSGFYSDGVAGYVKVVEFTTNGAYQDSEFWIKLSQRNTGIFELFIELYSGGGTEHTLVSFTKIGNTGGAFLYKRDSLTWELYVAKTSEWESVDVLDYKIGGHDYSIWTNWVNATASLPSGAIEATWRTEAMNISGTATRAFAVRPESGMYYGTGNRLTSANITPKNDSSLYTFLATSSMTEGKPISDGNIIHMEWDNTGYSTQLFVPHPSGKPMQFRAMYEGTWPSSWTTLLDNKNTLTIGSGNYGTSLPSAGTAGRIFFKKV